MELGVPFYVDVNFVFEIRGTQAELALQDDVALYGQINYQVDGGKTDDTPYINWDETTPIARAQPTASTTTSYGVARGGARRHMRKDCDDASAVGAQMHRRRLCPAAPKQRTNVLDRSCDRRRSSTTSHPWSPTGSPSRASRRSRSGCIYLSDAAAPADPSQPERLH